MAVPVAIQFGVVVVVVVLVKTMPTLLALEELQLTAELVVLAQKMEQPPSVVLPLAVAVEVQKPEPLVPVPQVKSLSLS